MVSHQEWFVDHVRYVQEEFWVCCCWVCDASIVCKWEIVGVCSGSQSAGRQLKGLRTGPD